MKRDIIDTDVLDNLFELYDDVRVSGPVIVSLDTGPVRSSSRYRVFTNSEFNIIVQELEGCTSILVVSHQGMLIDWHWM